MVEQSQSSEKERDQRQHEKEEAERASRYVSLKEMASLERLRDRIEAAAEEMSRLREENASLLGRVKELETRPAVDPKGTFLSLDHDPEQLRRKINTFIEAIDSYLERERGRS